jgi:adenine deaminase
MIREGASRRDLEAVASIKDEPIDFRRLILVTDSIEPGHLMEQGYMEFLVQKAIDLGFDPIVAIQMATLNAAEHFSLDNLIGGIAPGKCADMVLIPDLRTIKAEMVISNGQIIARDGQVMVPPRKHAYSRSTMRSVRLPGKIKPADFHIPVNGEDKPVTVRVINQVAVTLTNEEQITMIPERGFLEADIERDILKVAVIERGSGRGKMFTGFIKGFGLKKGAIAASAIWGLSGIVVVGAADEDMAGAVNRIFALQGGGVVYEGGDVLAEVPLPVAGKVSELPIEVLSQRFDDIQERAAELGTSLPNIHLSLTALTTAAIPFFRICEEGLMDIKKGELVGLLV